MESDNKIQDQLLSTAEKNAFDKKWYKMKADEIDSFHMELDSSINSVSEFKRMKVNYDIINNILDLKEFEYVCKPYGAEVGELPAKMVNRDIISGKVKVLRGMEMKRPFSWNVIAVNPEATTEREKKEFDLVRQYVINQIMLPIRQELEIKAAQETKGRELTPEEQQQITQQVEEQLKALTPKEVKKYMAREYQDPAEVLGNQLLQYFIQKEDLPRKFNEIFFHGIASAKEICYVGIVNNEPVVKVVNPLRFTCDVNGELTFIEDGEWAACEYRMSPSQVISQFNKELTKTEIQKIYEAHSKFVNQSSGWFSSREMMGEQEDNTIRVLHCVWKSLRMVKFLTYIDEETQQPQTILVSEDYKLNREAGDLAIDVEWIPEVYECWKIGTDIYKQMQPIPGQFIDMDNLYNAKLPYYGAIHDCVNSNPTSLVDRLKVYQYYYNIVMYKLEMLLASDKGKKILMNINAIPDSEEIDIKKWQYFLETTPVVYFNPDEEGKGYQDANTIAKEIDLSLASDISKYIELAEYLRKQAGISVGITDAVEGQIGPNEAVTNTKQNLIQSSHILEPYFDLHNTVKRNILQALLNTAKVCYSNKEPRKLSYILDDMSRQSLTIDPLILENATLGVFVSNSAKAEEAKDVIRQLTHAALQNQKVELSDVISVIRQDGIVEAEETLKLAEAQRKDFEQQMQQQQIQAQAEESEKERQFEREKHQMNIELTVLKEEERRKTEIAKASLIGASFNPKADIDGDGQNDFIEIMRGEVDMKVKQDKIALDRDKLEHQKKQDNEKLKLEKEKLEIARMKKSAKT